MISLLFERSPTPECESDYCDRTGAEALKAKIEAHWAAQGRSVHVWLEPKGFHPTIRAARYDVRSDLLNGQPRPTDATNIERSAA